jgi:GNAT superfamily N-acetyltransferase
MEFVRIDEGNRESVNAFLRKHWFSTDMVIRGTVVDLTRAEGFLSFGDGGDIDALITFLVTDSVCEVTSLDSLTRGRGAGTALIRAVAETARKRGCARVIVTTTNDNIRAIRFYQNRGFKLSNIYRDSLTAARRIKPEIPLTGENGVPLRHEIELELQLGRQHASTEAPPIKK